MPMMLPTRMSRKEGVLNTIHAPTRITFRRPHMRPSTAKVLVLCSSASLLSVTCSQQATGLSRDSLLVLSHHSGEPSCSRQVKCHQHFLNTFWSVKNSPSPCKCCNLYLLVDGSGLHSHGQDHDAGDHRNACHGPEQNAPHLHAAMQCQTMIRPEHRM